MADVSVDDIAVAVTAARYPSLDGRAVLVTGGASGIGASIAAYFVVQGAQVAILDRNADAAAALLDTIKQAGQTPPLFLPVDLTDLDATRAAVDKVIAEFGPVRALVNNAARDDRHDWDSVTPEFWEQSIGVNLRHQFFISQAVAPGMAEAGGGSIVNMGSVSWMVMNEKLPVYETAKAGVLGMTRALARELGSSGIRVNHVVPGWIMTERQKILWVTPESLGAMIQRQCLKRPLQPADVARLVLWLASDDSDGCTAQTFIIDGGSV